MGKILKTKNRKEKAVLIAASFSSGDASRINEYLDELEAEMMAAADALEFERAAAIRDRIQQILGRH